MGMNRRGVEALEIEQCHRRVDHEAEDAGAQHVPEGDGDKAHQRPFHSLHPRGAVLVAPMFPRLIAEYDERYDFERTERRADRHHRRRGAREIEVMERARHPADYEQRRSEEHTSELQSLMRSSYAVFCLKKKNTTSTNKYNYI